LRVLVGLQEDAPLTVAANASDAASPAACGAPDALLIADRQRAHARIERALGRSCAQPSQEIPRAR
jgi:hypothetical protein